MIQVSVVKSILQNAIYDAIHINEGLLGCRPRELTLRVSSVNSKFIHSKRKCPVTAVANVSALNYLNAVVVAKTYWSTSYD